MANRAGKKLIKATARTMANQATSKGTFTGDQLKGVVKTGTSMGVSKKSMQKAVAKGSKQSIKDFNKKVKSK
jgi:hypothetical protein